MKELLKTLFQYLMVIVLSLTITLSLRLCCGFLFDFRLNWNIRKMEPLHTPTRKLYRSRYDSMPQKYSSGIS